MQSLRQAMVDFLVEKGLTRAAAYAAMTYVMAQPAPFTLLWEHLPEGYPEAQLRTLRNHVHQRAIEWAQASPEREGWLTALAGEPSLF